MLFVCNYLRYPMLATELHLPAMLLSGGGPRFTRGDQMALIDPLDLAILAAISFGFGIPLASQLATESDPDIESLTLLIGWEKHEE